MNVIVYGTKNYNDLRGLEKIIEDSGFKITTMMTPLNIGTCETAEQWAARNDIPIFSLRINVLGIKETIGGKYVYDIADAAVLVYDKQDRFCKMIIEEMKKRGKKVYESVIKAESRRHNLRYSHRTVLQ